MNELCTALQPELAAWVQACAALEIMLAVEPIVARAITADGFSLVARSTAALALKHAWVTRDGNSLPVRPDAPPPA